MPKPSTKEGGFISHSSDESAIAIKIKAHLKQIFGEQTPVSVSSDFRSIKVGENWFEKISDNLKKAQVVLVLLSRDSVDRNWIAYLCLIDWKAVRWQNRAHFFSVAAQLMRRILVDLARAHHQAKRGGAARQVSLDEAAAMSVWRTPEFIALDEALEQLATFDPRKCRMVGLRFFGGLSEEETAEVLKVSPRMVRREWSLARAWLHRELRRGEQDEA